MDDALKARLIGATVLVALAVLLVPELLSGRKPADLDAKPAGGAQGTRTFTIELGGSAQGTPASPPSPPAAGQSVSPGAAPTGPATTAAAPEETTAKADGGAIAQAANAREPSTAAVPAPEAKPASGANVPPPGVAEPPAAAAATARPPAPVSASPAAAVPARGGWAVQVGAFGSTEAASKLVKSLQAAGYTAYVSPVSRAGKALYRVRVGPVAERTAAVGMVDGLKAKGLPATVVAND